MGNYVAIPHETEDAKETVKASGIVIVQVPDGVDFGNGNVVKEENVDRIIRAADKKEILRIFNEVNE